MINVRNILVPFKLYHYRKQPRIIEFGGLNFFIAKIQNRNIESLSSRIWARISEWLLINRVWGKSNNFIMEKSGRHHLNQLIKLTSPVISHVDIMCPQYDEKGTSFLYSFPPKVHNCSLIMRKYQTLQNEGKFYKILHSSKVSSSWKTGRD